MHVVAAVINRPIVLAHPIVLSHLHACADRHWRTVTLARNAGNVFCAKGLHHRLLHTTKASTEIANGGRKNLLEEAKLVNIPGEANGNVVVDAGFRA
jgi:hypothetical protein